MITKSNYFEQSQTIDWAKLPKTLSETKNDIEEIFEFYDDDEDVKEAIDMFISQLNNNLAKAPESKAKPKIDKAPVKKERKATSIYSAMNATKYLQNVMPPLQKQVVLEMDKSEESDYFLEVIKKLDADLQDATKIQGKSLKDSLVKLHFFYGGSDWYVLDYDPKNNEFFAYVILNGDTQFAEAGYVSVKELHTVKGVEMDFNWKRKKLGEIMEVEEAEASKPKKEEYTTFKPESETEKKPVKKITEKNLVNGLTVEYMLMRRLFNMMKSGAEIPFNRIKLLYAAFQKAALERKVRKTSDDADLFTKCSKKIVKLFEAVDAKQANAKIQIEDDAFYVALEKRVAGTAIDPSISLLKRFVNIQGTKPDAAKAQLLLNSIKKRLEAISKSDTNKQLLEDAENALSLYISEKKSMIEVTHYGLSRPRSVCTNRIKCVGIDKSGKLKKGYKFQEGTGNVIQVKKKSPSVSPLNQPYTQDQGEVKNELKPLQKPTPQRKYKTVRDYQNNVQHELFEIDGDLRKFLGKIERKPIQSLAVTLDSPEGGGKTHTIYQWANAFCNAGYSTIIWSFEEHASSNLAIEKAEKYFGENIDNIPVMSEEDGDTPMQTYQRFVESIPDFDVIMVDSWTKLVEMNKNINFDLDFRKKFNGKLFVIIVQRTSSGEMRGGTKVGFDGDIILKVHVDREDFRNNYVYNHKNRYNDYVPMSELKYSPYHQGLLPLPSEEPQEVDEDYQYEEVDDTMLENIKFSFENNH